MNTCVYCGIETSNPKFCSKSCSAKFNNNLSPKRTKKHKTCKSCGVLLESRNTYCKDCLCKSGVAYRGSDLIASKTIQENSSEQGKHANAYRSIRESARRALIRSDRERKCAKCGYTHYVECCHKKSISSFAKETLVSIVNSLDNLVWLCPNCHWEFDHGLLDLD